MVLALREQLDLWRCVACEAGFVRSLRDDTRITDRLRGRSDGVKGVASCCWRPVDVLLDRAVRGLDGGAAERETVCDLSHDEGLQDEGKQERA